MTLKRASLNFAVAITCHSAIVAVDHLGEIISHNGTGSKLETIKLHHTKCSHLITEVISPALKSELRNDVQGRKYLLLIDESTDIASPKKVCICIRYPNKQESKIITAFVGLVLQVKLHLMS